MSAWQQPEPTNWWHVVEDALSEDVGSGDLSSGCIDPELLVDWYIDVQGDGVVCGVGVAEFLLGVFDHDPDDASLNVVRRDGERVLRGDRIIEGRLPARRALMAERTALNFLMFLSGVSTLTAEFMSRVEGTGARVVDTRKTIPNMRALQKYAVRCGGGANHRMGLYDAVMIKDNHVRAAGGITEAVSRIRSYVSHLTKIEVECETLDQVAECVEAGVDVVMLDNMDPFMMREAVKNFRGRVVFEASGGVSLDTVRGVAQTGVDYISVGALTHSAPSLPFHMEIR